MKNQFEVESFTLTLVHERNSYRDKERSIHWNLARLQGIKFKY